MTLTTNLVSDWPMNETAGANLTDIVDSNTGTASGSPGQGTALILGTHSRSLVRSSSQKFTFPSGFISTYGSWSFEIWWETTSTGITPQWETVFSFGTSTNSYISFTPKSGAANNTGSMQCSLKLSGTETDAPLPQVTVAGTTYHLIITCTSNRVSIYLNGACVSGIESLNASGTNLAPTTNYLGQDEWTDPYFDGDMQQARLWSRELSTQEAQALYNSGNGLANASLASTTIPAAPSLNPYGRKTYVMPSFSGNGSGAAFVMTESFDAIYWTSFSSSYTQQTGHVVRDPSICVFNEQVWMAHTAQNNSSGYFDIAIANSFALTAFTFVISPNTSSIDSGSGHTWAPTWVTNSDSTTWINPSTGYPSLIVAISSSDDTGNGLYEMHPTNTGFTSWSSPVQLTGTGIASNPIDGHCVIDNSGEFWLWHKDETGGYIVLAKSSTFLSGYTSVYTGNALGFGANTCEAPFPIYINGQWYVYVDRYGIGPGWGVGYFTCGANFTSPSNLAGLSSDLLLRHGSILNAELQTATFAISGTSTTFGQTGSIGMITATSTANGIGVNLSISIGTVTATSTAFGLLGNIGTITGTITATSIANGIGVNLSISTGTATGASIAFDGNQGVNVLFKGLLKYQNWSLQRALNPFIPPFPNDSSSF